MLASAPRSLLAWFSVASCPAINHQLCSPQRETHRNTQLIHPCTISPLPDICSPALRQPCTRDIKTHMEWSLPGARHPSTFIPTLPIPRHSHPGASDSHSSPRCGSIDRLHVLSCARSRGGSARHHRAHHPGGGSGLPGLPAALHACFVPHLEDGGVAEKDLRSDPTCSSSCRNFVVFCR